MPNPPGNSHVIWGDVEVLHEDSSTDQSNPRQDVDMESIEFRQLSSSSGQLSSSGGQSNESEEFRGSAAPLREEPEQGVAPNAAASSWQSTQFSAGPEAVGPDSDHEQHFFGAAASSSDPMGEELLPSIGSRRHAAGKCRPCRFVSTSVGCKNGYRCGHCHLHGDTLLRTGRPSARGRAKTKQFVADALGRIQDPILREAQAEEFIRNARGRHYQDYIARVARWTLESLTDHAVQEDVDAQSSSPVIVAPVPEAATLAETLAETYLEDSSTDTGESPRGKN